MEVKISEFRKHESKSLRGFLSIRFPLIGFEISDIALHQQNGKRWLQLPAKPFTRPDGSKGWNYILSFYERLQYQKFQEMALKALDDFQRETGRNDNGKQKT
jgi:hypothetical protein